MPEQCELPVLRPDLQVSFSERLQELRGRYMHEALAATVCRLDIGALDDELAAYVESGPLSRLAALGIRGEVVFPVPYVLAANPCLLGYYRLLLGFSEKEFYHRDVFAAFRTLEKRGQLPPRLSSALPALCRSLVQSAQLLVTGIQELSVPHIHELQLLVLGASLRGSELNRIGQRAAQRVFGLIRGILAPYSPVVTAREMSLTNESGRQVTVRFSGDPDVLLWEQLPSHQRTLLSIEIKGGADASNVYNRIGEAEKSHLSQYELGCRECWTIIRAPFKPDKAREKSPHTTRFFRFGEVVEPGGSEFVVFRDQLASIVGIRIPE